MWCSAADMAVKAEDAAAAEASKAELAALVSYGHAPRNFGLEI